MKQVAFIIVTSRPCGRLYGPVRCHPKFRDGSIVLTSPVVRDFGNIVVTKNTVYILEKES